MIINNLQSNYDYNVVKIRVNRDYDPGWTDGDMEIFIKYKYKYKYGGNWSSWNQTGTVSGVEEDKEESFNKSIGGYSNPQIFNIQMWEEDTFSDDIVCNEGYLEVRDENDNINLNLTEIYNDLGGYDRRLTDHSTSHYSKIWIELNL